MTKRYSILQAKLQELESRLPDPFLHHHHIQFENLSEDDKQKLAFVKNLLSAEISSSPQSSKKPRHLQHLAQRVANLENAFSDQQFDLVLDSSCSCTESCFNDDDDDDDGEDTTDVDDFAENETNQVCEGFIKPMPMVESTETEDFPEGYNGEKKNEQAMVEWEGEAKKETKKFDTLLVYEDAEDHFLEGFAHGGLVIAKKGLKEELVKKGIVLRNIEMRREERSVKKRSIWGAMSCGIVVGMVLMGFTMLKFCGCFLFVDQPCFITPT